jgi:hypothetical protein
MEVSILTSSSSFVILPSIHSIFVKLIFKIINSSFNPSLIICCSTIKLDIYILSGENINAKGVCQFNYTEDYDDNTIFSVKFKVPGEVSKFLREDLGIRGLFFVRQKCIPNIIA